MSGKTLPLKTVSQEGDGLYVEFFIGSSDGQFDFLWEPKVFGITILIEEQNNFPIRKTGVFAQPGSYASIVVKKAVSKSLPSPYGSCVEIDSIDTILSREMKILGLNYNHRNCMNLCEQKQNIDKLGCYSLRLPKILNAKPCLNRTQYYMLRNMEYNNGICEDLCPFECEKTNLNLEVSYAGFPTHKYYYDSINNNQKYMNGSFGNTTFEVFKSSIVSVSVYFDELTKTTIEESPSLSIVDLVADIGGTLGLFIGISVLTFTEIMILFIDVFCIWF